MAARVIARILVSAVGPVVRAFAQAYRQAAQRGAAEAARGARPAAAQAAESAGAGAGAGARTETSESARAAVKKGGMSLDEARQILNVSVETKPEDIATRYSKLFELTDKKNGGSFYLQSKVYRAKERIDIELEELLKNRPPPPPSSSSSSSTSN